MKYKRDEVGVTIPIDRATVSALDRIREASPLRPSRSQLIRAALAEYVEKYGSRVLTPSDSKENL